jgi:hypothetical protein
MEREIVAATKAVCERQWPEHEWPGLFGEQDLTWEMIRGHVETALDAVRSTLAEPSEAAIRAACKAENDGPDPGVLLSAANNQWEHQRVSLRAAYAVDFPR